MLYFPVLKAAFRLYFFDIQAFEMLIIVKIKKQEKIVIEIFKHCRNLVSESLGCIQELWGSLNRNLFLLCVFQVKLPNICQIHRFVKSMNVLPNSQEMTLLQFPY